MHPLLEIEAFGLKRVSNLFEIKTSETFGAYKKGFTFAPAFRNRSNLFEKSFKLSFKVIIKNIWCSQKDVLSLHPLLAIEVIWFEKSFRSGFKIIIKNIWCNQKDVLSLHSLLEIEAFGLKRVSDQFEIKTSKHLVLTKKGFTFAPAFKDEQLSAKHKTIF